MAFFVHSLSTGIGCFYGLVSLQFVFYQFMISLLVSVIICRRGESQLFHITRSTCRKYQLHFVELCVHVHLLCASLSLLGKYRANNYLSDVAVLFQLRTLSTFHILDVVATLSILAAHLAGHHDVIDRIYRRLGWVGRGVQRYVRWFVEVSLKLLDEIPSDLEDQSGQSVQEHELSARKTRSLPISTPIYSTNSLLDSRHQEAVEPAGSQVHDPSDGEPPGRFPLRRVSSTFIRREIRSFKAQFRWSAVRYALGFEHRPFQDTQLLVTVLRQAFEPMPGSDNFQPGFHFPRRGDGSSSITSTVMDMMDRQNPLRIPPRWGPRVNSYGANLTPSMQLPGTIQGTCVKALPDTGSSQNVIDSFFMQTLSPAVTVEPLGFHDKPLVAPDGVVIPCAGKVYLPWAFEKEAKLYPLCFYVVENCLHEVIIGNGFLRGTETFEEHQERLEISIRSDLEDYPENLASQAQESSCRRQIVSGTINGQRMNASLDTGCEANLMSIDYARQRGLNPKPLPNGNQEIMFTNGRKGPTLGQVEVDWIFDDDSSNVVVKIKCHVLPRCRHSVIFGVQFAVSEKPWQKHRSTLSWEELSDGDAGVVGLVNTRRFLNLGKTKTSEFPGFGAGYLLH